MAEENENKTIETSPRKGGLSTPVWAAIAVAALVVGVLVGHFVFRSSSSVSLDGATTCTEDKLDDTIATYTYGGETYKVTSREVITTSSSLDSAKNDDDTYNVPTADDVVSYARNQIVLKAAADEGYSVTDDDVSTYANDTLGTDDYATIGSNYNLDEDTTKTILTDAALMKKLRDAKVTTTIPDAPTAPTAPSDGNTDTASSDYAQYIIALAGDEWDATNNTWASTDGTYYTALSSYSISNDSATYEAAEAAYYVAYSNYQTASSEASTEWTDYVNTLLSNATIQIGSLAV